MSHNYLEVKSSLELSSDHTPIIVNINTHVITHENQQNCTIKQRTEFFSETHWMTIYN
jgi:hypothetical protein